MKRPAHAAAPPIIFRYNAAADGATGCPAISPLAMSGLGYQATLRDVATMSALPQKTDELYAPPKAETLQRAARRIFRKIEITAKRQGADRGLLRRRPVLADQFHEPIMVLRHVGSIRQAVEYLQDRVVIFRRARL